MGLSNTPPTGNGTGAGGSGTSVFGPGAGGPPAPPQSQHPLSQQGAGSADVLINYNEKFKNAPPALFRDPVIDQVASVLIGKYKPNPLMVGSPGVGKTAVAEEIARRIANDDPWVPSQLKGYTIFELPLGGLVAGAGIVGELESRLTEIIDYASEKKNKAIIYIDEIHLICNDRSQTYQKIAELLKPALARGNMKVMGATTIGEARDLDDDPAFARRFTRVSVDELSRNQTTEILRLAMTGLSKHYTQKVDVRDELLKVIPGIADEHRSGGNHRPDNALTLLDRAMADTRIGHARAIRRANDLGDSNMVAMLQGLASIPLTEKKVRGTAMRLMTGNAVKDELDMDLLREQLSTLQGQDEALDRLMDMIERDSMSIFPRTKPMTMLLVGPSGVGKTESTKAISQALTGMTPIRLNMQEYSSKSSITKIIGADPGYVGSDTKKELPFDSLETNPYRVILLDEIEKAHQEIHQLFLSAIDEGTMQTARGKTIDFTKSIIIATSNAGSDKLTAPRIGFQSDQSQSMTREELVRILKETFPPELLGRFSSLVQFQKLEKPVYAQIVLEFYRTKRAQVIERSSRHAGLLPESITDEEAHRITEETYVPSQGARPAERAVQELIENALMGRLVLEDPAATSITTIDDDTAQGDSDQEDPKD